MKHVLQLYDTAVLNLVVESGLHVCTHTQLYPVESQWYGVRVLDLVDRS